MREIEPHVGGVAALRVPQEGIVDYARGVRGAGGAPGSARGARVVTGARVDAAAARRRGMDRRNARRRIQRPTS